MDKFVTPHYNNNMENCQRKSRHPKNEIFLSDLLGEFKREFQEGKPGVYNMRGSSSFKWILKCF